MMKKKSIAASVLLLLAAAFVLYGPRRTPSPRPSTKTQIAKNYGKLPLSFEKNAGQTDAGVSFLSRGKGYTLFLGPNEAVLGLHKQQAPRRRAHSAPPPELLASAGKDEPAASQVELRMQLVDANPAPQVAGRQELPGKSNYFIGNDPAKWRTNIPTYAKVEYQEVYSGVDLVYYGNGKQLEHDFVVKPGTNPQVITLGFPGADKLTLNAQGGLDVNTRGETVTLQAPVIYQNGHAGKQLVSGRYAIKGAQQVGFEVDAYDASETLVIDPVLVYSTYVGGSDEDFGTDIAVDSTGAAYIVGQTISVNYPVSATAFQKTFVPSINDGFVTKLTPDGSALAYSTYIGGATLGDTGTEAIGIIVDASGNAYITGDTDATYPTTPGAFQTTKVGNVAHSFVTKLNSTGSALLYSTFLGGDSFDIGFSIAVDAAGEAYVAGQTFSGTFPNTTANILSYVGGSYLFVTKVNATGTALVFSILQGSKALGVGDTQGRGIVVDSAGAAYVAGQTTSTDYLTTPGAFRTTYQGGQYDAVMLKVSSTGTRVYSTLVGATGFDQGRAVAIDSAGNAYMTGQTFSADFPTTAGAFQTSIGGVGSDRTGCTGAGTPLNCADAFLIKMNATGTAAIFSTFLGGGGEDQGDHGCGTDSQGNVYVTGFTHSLNFPLGPNPIQSTFQGGGYDAFVAKFSPTGGLLYSTYLGGNFTDSGRALAVLSPGVVYVMGYTSSTTFPTTAGAFRTTNASISPAGFDSFVSKITETAAPAVNLSMPAAFAPQVVNTTSAAKPVTLSNTGTAPLTFTSIAVTGDFAQTNNCVSPIAAGGNCTINVTFTPIATGIRSGSLTVTDNAAGSPHSVPLTGTGNAATAPVVSMVAPAAFANQVINTTSAAKAVTLSNTGNAPLTFTSIATTGDFAQTNNCVSPIAAAASCTINVTFTPTVVGARAGILTVTDNAVGSPHSVNLSGTGTAAPAPVVSLPAPAAFANQVINTTSAAKAVTLSNTGNAPLTFTSIATTGDFAQTNNCVSPIAAAASCTINVTFTPTVVGARAGTLTVTDNAVGSPHSVNLSGTGTATPAPVVSLPAPAAFANQVINTTSAAKAVTLSNTGNAPLTFTSIATTGDFAQTNNCVSPIAAAASCTINVTFTPTVVGARAGTLTVTDNAVGSPHSVNLSGTGTATPVPVVSLPAPAAFANQVINTTSAAKAVTLSNTGNAPLTFTSIATTGDFAQTNNCVSPIAAAASCTINVTFTPTVVGARAGTLTVTDNAVGSPHSVNLSGTGTAAPAPSTGLTTPSAFSNQVVNTTSSAKAVTLSNTGNAPLTISTIAATGDFAQTNTCVSPLAAAASCTINVTFTPTVAGARAGTLTVTDNAAGSPHSVNLSGTGIAAAPVASLATPAAFAAQVLNTTSAAQPVTLSNTGNAPLTISTIAATGDFAQTNNCVSPLAAAASCTISVTFTPTVLGARTGSLTVTDNAAGSPHSVALSGSGVTANNQTTTATVSPSTIVFSIQKVGTASVSKQVTLKNTGTAPLAITSITVLTGVGGVSTDFVQTNNCGASVPVGGSCTIDVSFAPPSGGPKSGWIQIIDNTAASPQRVSLSGYGLL